MAYKLNTSNDDNKTNAIEDFYNINEQNTDNNELNADNNELNNANKANWYIRDWQNYETATADGGFLDTYNALKQEIDFTINQYKLQLGTFSERKAALSKDCRNHLLMTAFVILIPVFYNLILYLLTKLGANNGFFSMLWFIFYIIEFPVLFIAYIIMLPGLLRNTANRMWQMKYLNSGPGLIEYRRNHGIVSFYDEEQFLNNKINEYNEFCHESEINGYNRSDGKFSIYDNNEMIPEQKQILDKMRKMSIFEEYRASVADTKRDAGPMWMVVCIGAAFLIGGLLVAYT